MASSRTGLKGIALSLISKVTGLGIPGLAGLLPVNWRMADWGANAVGLSYNQALTTAYIPNPFVHRAVKLIAEGGASIEWLYYIDKQNGDRDELKPGKYSFQEELTRPSKWVPASKFRREILTQLLLAGKCFVFRTDDINKSSKQELHLLDPDQVQVTNPVRVGDPFTFAYAGETFSEDRILYIALGDRMKPVAPLSAALQSALQNNIARQWNFSLLKNMGKAPAVLETEQQLTSDYIDMLKEKFEAETTGETMGSKPLVLAGGLKYKDVASTPFEMDWLQGYRQSARDIGVALGVPSEMLGDPEVKTYASFQKASRSLYTKTIMPMVRDIMDAFASWYSVQLPGLIIQPNEDAIPELSESMNDRYNRVNNATFLTINEKRESTGWDPLEDEKLGDQILLPGITTSLEMLGQSAEALGAENLPGDNSVEDGDE